MVHKVPKKEEIVEAILQATLENGVINSQKKFREIVLKKLKEKNVSYAATGRRIRKIALQSDKINIEIKTAEVNRHNPSKCPVCGSKFIPQRNKTVFNGTVTLGYQCSKCPYWTGLKYRRPTRYVFSKKYE